MKLSDLFSSRSDFASEREVKRAITSSKNFDSERERPEDATTMLLFSTSRQQTWLVCTPLRLYCILDDLRNEAPKVNWSIGRDELVSSDAVTIPLRVRPRSERSGLVDIGDRHQGWLFSQKLFRDQEVAEKIRALVSNQMLSSSLMR